MRRIFLIILVLLVAAGVMAFAMKGTLVEKAGERVLDKISKRLGMPVVAESIVDEGWTAVRFRNVRVGDTDQPFVVVKEIRGTVDQDALWSADIKPQSIEISGATLHLYGDGTLEGVAKALRDALPKRIKNVKTDGGGASQRLLPPITVRDSQVIDHGAALTISEIEVDLENRVFDGKMRVIVPPLGQCSYGGTTSAVTVECEKGLSRDLPKGFRGSARTIEFTRTPNMQVRLPDLALEHTDPDSELGELVPRIQADVTLGLERNEDGRWPIEAKLPLPGGGQITATGTADRQSVNLRTEVEGLRVGPAHEAVDGELSAKVRLDVDLVQRTLLLEGKGTLKDFEIEHRALAQGPIGPFDLEFGGRIDAAVAEGAPLSAVKVELTDGRFVLGSVPLKVTASFDATGEKPVVRADAEVPEVTGAQLTAAIPVGLLPRLQPIEMAGQFKFDAHLALDMADLKATELEANPHIRKLKFVQMSPRISFSSLRRVFRTRFEMPGGETIVRTTGPGSSRWTPLSQIPALLPAAVVAQEDGGFYRHRGVSMLHLRGSLIRNLESERFARGGSTLTMQLARNLFLHRRKTLARKLEELILTWQLERRFSKDQLITLYLNVVEFGPRIFGIGDAARHYFDKRPIELDPVEIVFLTRLLPSPRRFYPMFRRRQVTGAYGRKMGSLLRRLVSRKKLSAAVYETLDPMALWHRSQNTPPPGEEGGPEDGGGDSPGFLDDEDTP